MRRTIRDSVLALLWWLGAVAYAAVTGLPDPTLTPGAASPSVTPANIHDTICARGYTTKRVRPPSGYTNRLKSTQLMQYGYVDRNPRDYEEDHLIPLDIGGDPRNPQNLWPEPRYGEWNAGKKDKLEDKAKQLVCSGAVPLRQLQREIDHDWIKAYQQYIRP
ncbi:MAG: hypothetical protein ACYC9L_04070 [Sulfuricaulis sp.]